MKSSKKAPVGGKSIPMKTYLLKLKGEGQQKITIPAAWKVTFGPLIPGSKGTPAYNGTSGVCLRLYDGTSQRACFTDVEYFRDTSIIVEELIIKTQRETAYKDTPDGKKSFIVEGRVSEWRNADEPQKPEAEFLSLPKADLDLEQ